MTNSPGAKPGDNLTFSPLGKCAYHCGLHPLVTGEIVVP